MNYEVHCPVCSEKEWHHTGSKIYKSSDKHWKSGYPKMQKAVFFEFWHRNKTVVEMKRFVCKKCGFVIDMPRPDDQDVDNKYRHLAIVEKDLGSSRAIPPKAMKQEHNQANEILNLVKSQLVDNAEVLDILDYGGGAGHFLIPMIKEGHNCYLVDYNKYPLHGITRLGDTLEDIPMGQKFDFIICRRVLEHVASPRKLTTDFKEYLKDNGLVYVEVPIELFGATNPGSDPVTHINYFQKDSLRILFECAGFMPIISRQTWRIYHGTGGMVALILAHIDSTPANNILYKNSFEETMLFMRSSLKIQMRHPLEYCRSVFMRLGKKIIGKITRWM